MTVSGTARFVRGVAIVFGRLWRLEDAGVIEHSETVLEALKP